MNRKAGDGRDSSDGSANDALTLRTLDPSALSKREGL